MLLQVPAVLLTPPMVALLLVLLLQTPACTLHPSAFFVTPAHLSDVCCIHANSFLRRRY